MDGNFIVLSNPQLREVNIYKTLPMMQPLFCCAMYKNL